MEHNQRTDAEVLALLTRIVSPADRQAHALHREGEEVITQISYVLDGNPGVVSTTWDSSIFTAPEDEIRKRLEETLDWVRTRLREARLIISSEKPN